MKNLQNEISGLQLKELSSHELVEYSGGWEWLDRIAHGVGYAVGMVVHAVIDAALILSGNYEAH